MIFRKTITGRKNRELKNLSNITYIELPSNIGRSAIRNMLARKAKYRYLIFMDCDAAVCKLDYIKCYVDKCHPQVVCYGGRINTTQAPEHQYLLRWRYGISREETSAEIRNKTPNKNFLTFNFLIDKELFNKIAFDENIKGYGHEDTLFGIELEKLGIRIEHIDNPLLNKYIDTTDVFIKKTEQSIGNLLKLDKRLKDKHFTDSTKLLKTANKISALHLNGLFAFAFSISKKKLLNNLFGNNPKLYIFDFYKLGYLCSLKQKE
ncbi:MAG: glycosyltransferase family 2 protein [Dysgonomonas sp.]